MSDDKPTGRAWISGVAVIALAIVAGVISMIAFDEGIEPPEPKEPLPPRPTVTPSAPRPPAERDVAARQRVSLDPPPERLRPERPEDPEPTPLTPDMRRKMNYFVDDILKAARDECILPWLAEFPEPTNAEMVIDAVLYDGQLYDVGVRSLDHDLPGDVRSCIGDQAWSQVVPELDLPGELRLQRSITYRN